MIQETKDKVAISKGYPSWEKMENFIIDHNPPVVVAQLLVRAMEEVAELMLKSDPNVHGSVATDDASSNQS